MNPNDQLRTRRENLRFNIGFALALGALLMIGVATFRSGKIVAIQNAERANTRQALLDTEILLSLLHDAETGQRGFLLTGKEEYLENYNDALPVIHPQVEKIRAVFEEENGGKENYERLRALIDQKLDELEKTVSLGRTRGVQSALEVVRSDQGMVIMEAIRDLLEEMKSLLNERLANYSREVAEVTRRMFWVISGGNVMAVALVCLTALFFFRDKRRRQAAEESVRRFNLVLEERVTERTNELELERARFETVLRQMPAAVLVTDASGDLVFGNHRVEEILGKSAHWRKNMSQGVLWKGFHLDGRPLESGDWPLARSLKSGEVVTDEITEIQRDDGSRAFLSLSSAPIFEGAGRVAGALMVCVDATDRLTYEKERADLMVREASALEAARLKSQFLANMSHEIRTPLNGIIGMTDLLLDTELTPEQSRQAKIVQDSGNALLTIINDILDLSKIEAGKLSLEIIDFNAVTLIESQADLLAPRASEKGLSLMTFVDPSLPAYLRGDPGRIAQVILNLVSNAIKFTEKGSIVVRTLVEEALQEETRIRVTVKDTGIGLDPGTIQRLFQPFTQADDSTARKYGGTGLGLSICRELVEMMNGRIGVESQPGEGATFWFTCSLKNSSVVAPAGRVGSGPMSGLNVLIVDDDPAAGEIAASYLHHWGMRTERVTDGISALAALRRASAEDKPFQLALIDQRMPGMTGVELAHSIRTDASAVIPLILMTAYDHISLSEEVRSAGFSGHLMKPLKQSELHDRIADAMKDDRSRMTELVSPRAETEPTSSGFRILVAEDNQVNQMLTQTILRNLGHSSHVVANGREAIAALLQASYDLVLMDCQMPEMDGFEATRLIRIQEVRIPIVALTANAMTEDRKKCLDAGMDDYVAKPVKKEILKAVLSRWLPSGRPSQKTS